MVYPTGTRVMYYGGVLDWNVWDTWFFVSEGRLLVRPFDNIVDHPTLKMLDGGLFGLSYMYSDMINFVC